MVPSKAIIFKFSFQSSLAHCKYSSPPRADVLLVPKAAPNSTDSLKYAGVVDGEYAWKEIGKWFGSPKFESSGGELDGDGGSAPKAEEAAGAE